MADHRSSSICATKRLAVARYMGILVWLATEDLESMVALLSAKRKLWMWNHLY